MSSGDAEYRIARFRDRLVGGEVAELGVRIEVRGSVVLLTGTIPTADHREEILRIAEAELAGLSVHSDLLVARADPPDRPEELR
ncbi:BON domain-containing protein [Streptomyces venezuelae]|uniref:BON domain-containing protein n=1 Tax=Streptomyces venezuelae TaxID=54571 RepID=UPI00278C81C3|nr:BON domain-containing protein [Streptomyces venezuelae]